MWVASSYTSDSAGAVAGGALSHRSLAAGPWVGESTWDSGTHLPHIRQSIGAAAVFSKFHGESFIRKCEH